MTSESAKTGVSMVIPAHNEEGNIAELLRQCEATVTEHPWLDLEVILIDDGSEDATWTKMEEGFERYDFVSLVRLRRRRGLAIALAEGFKKARHDILAFYPADLQFLPGDLPKLVTPLRDDPQLDMVCGKRIGEYDRWFVTGIYRALSRNLFNVKVADQNSVKAFRKELVTELYLRSNMHRYIVAIASYKGYRIDETPIPLYPRNAGKSKFSSPLRTISGILDLIAIKFELKYMERPMIFFGFIGLFLAALGFLLAVSFFFLKTFGVVSPDAKITFLMTGWGCIMVGTTLFGFGLLSDYLLRITAPELHQPPPRTYRSARNLSSSPSSPASAPEG